MLQINPIGANQTELCANGMKVLFSYQTPVAAYIDGEYFRTDKHYSSTTTKHINKWLDVTQHDKINYKYQDFFDNLVKQFKIEV